MTIKIIVSLIIGIILWSVAGLLYWKNKKQATSQIQIKNERRRWVKTTLPLAFLISGLLVILFGCLNF